MTVDNEMTMELTLYLKEYGVTLPPSLKVIDHEDTRVHYTVECVFSNDYAEILDTHILRYFVWVADLDTDVVDYTFKQSCNVRDIKGMNDPITQWFEYHVTDYMS